MRSFFVENPPGIFEPRVPASESDFEAQVLRVASKIMPNFNAASWKPLVKDRHGHGAKPDLAMISRDLENWYVIEVELASHSIPQHIAPQLETLANGIYDSALLPSLRKAFPLEDPATLTRMVRRDPGLLCVVNEYTDRIWRTCRDAGFDLVVLEPYFAIQAGWAVLVERMPSTLTRVSAPSTYSLSRAERLGDSVVMMLPKDFPASFYKIRTSVEHGDEDHRYFQIHRFENGPGVVLPLAMITNHITVSVEIIDPSEQLVQLVLDS